MSFTALELTPHTGTQIKADLDTLLDGSIASDLRAILEQRGVLLFRNIDMTEEQQLLFAKNARRPAQRTRHRHHQTVIRQG